MGSIGLNIVQQSMINIKYKINPSHNPLPQSNPFSGLKFTQSKINKVGNFRIVKASTTEGTNMSTTIDKLGVRIEKNPPQTRLSQLGVLQWPKWGCPPSKFPWTYEAKETCYLLQGKVKVYPDGSNEPVEFGAGDLVVFPKGMKCTWDVAEAVDKHYKFEVIDDEHLEAKQLPVLPGIHQLI